LLHIHPCFLAASSLLANSCVRLRTSPPLTHTCTRPHEHSSGQEETPPERRGREWYRWWSFCCWVEWWQRDVRWWKKQRTHHYESALALSEPRHKNTAVRTVGRTGLSTSRLSVCLRLSTLFSLLSWRVMFLCVDLLPPLPLSSLPPFLPPSLLLLLGVLLLLLISRTLTYVGPLNTELLLDLGVTLQARYGVLPLLFFGLRFPPLVLFLAHSTYIHLANSLNPCTHTHTHTHTHFLSLSYYHSHYTTLHYTTLHYNRRVPKRRRDITRCPWWM
jgi:hypothetical protein